MNDLLPKVKKFVDRSFKNENTIHFERTVHWVKQLNPDADDALLIAAYSHDIQRAFRSEEIFKKIGQSDKGFQNEEMLKLHQEDGAKIMTNFLSEQNADSILINKVANLIEKHEVGGDADQNLLKDADSISFFETNAEHFVTEKSKEFGKDKIKKKFDWMFERISSDKAKEIARPMYEQALKLLENRYSQNFSRLTKNFFS